MTLGDVSRHVGLSVATVSRVLSGSPRVRQATRDQVLRAADELGYSANLSARALKTQRTDMLGVVFPDINNEFYRELLTGINDEAHAAGRHLMVEFGPGPRWQSLRPQDYLFGGRIDALILLNLGLPMDFLRDLAGRGTPLVLMDRPAPGVPAATVRLENVAGADAAMSHLLEHGYRRIAVLRGPGDSYDANERWRGCERALRRFGVELDHNLIWEAGFYEAYAYTATQRWLADHDAPEAILALNDAMAIGALHALREHGLSVPQDVALVGFDDVDCAKHLGLTTVHCPIRQMGQAAARAALNLMATDEPAAFYREEVLDTHLIVRTSCGCVPDDNPISQRPPINAVSRLEKKHARPVRPEV